MGHMPVHAALILGLTAGSASAASLQVAPILLDIPDTASAAVISVRNSDSQAITAQLRVFRWTQIDGQERLEPTDDVVASPPVVELRPRQDYTVRVVRLTRQPVSRQESYRLVVDELPKPQQRSGTIAVVLRHVVPVFFTPRDTASGPLRWALRQQGGRTVLQATNAHDGRVRIAAVSIRDKGGRVVGTTEGLLGYALGRSSMQWPLAMTGRPPSSGSTVTITGTTETGPFHATSVVQAAP